MLENIAQIAVLLTLGGIWFGVVMPKLKAGFDKFEQAYESRK